MKIFKLFVFVIMFLSFVGYVHSATLDVCPSGCAYSSIQDAIDVAVDGDTVLVNDGVYEERIHFFDEPITVKSVNGPANTIIDGKGYVGCVVKFISSKEITSILEGFTVRNGTDGGIVVNESSPEISNCIITSNSSPSNNRAGGIHCWISSKRETPVTITDCVITDNEGSGGINCSSSVISNCVISNNKRWINSGGGGIRCSSSVISDCIITDNKGGSGISASYSITITNCVITGNSAGTGDGGGVSCASSHADPTIITNCIIADNTSYKGGGIYCEGFESSPLEGSPIITNCVIANNIASYGASSGAAIFCIHGSLPAVSNSIIWGNKERSIQGVYTDNTIYESTNSYVTITYSNIQGGWMGKGNIDEIPLFIDPNEGNYHLRFDSLCIDTGDPNSSVADDIDGTIRPKDGNNDGKAVCDMGAYEFVFTNDSDSTTDDALSDSNSSNKEKATVNLEVTTEILSSGLEVMILDKVNPYCRNYAPITVDNSGRVHIVYSAVDRYSVRYATNLNSVWQAIDIFHSPRLIHLFGADIQTDKSDNVHTAFGSYDHDSCCIDSDEDGKDTDLIYATNSGGEWKTAVLDDSTFSIRPQIAIDSNNNLHIAYFHYNSLSMRYATNTGGNWNTTVLASGLRYYGCSIALDSNENLHLVYSAIEDRNLYYAKNSSGIWEQELIDDYADKVSILVDSQDIVHIFCNYFGLRHINNSSGYFTVIEDTDTDRSGWHISSIVMDENDNFHIVYLAKGGGIGQLKYLTNSSGGWKDYTIDKNVKCINPSLAIDREGNLHVSYTVKEDTKYLRSMSLRYVSFHPSSDSTLEDTLSDGNSPDSTLEDTLSDGNSPDSTSDNTLSDSTTEDTSSGDNSSSPVHEDDKSGCLIGIL
jgi:hypothetical protein